MATIVDSYSESNINYDSPISTATYTRTRDNNIC